MLVPIFQAMLFVPVLDTDVTILTFVGSLCIGVKYKLTVHVFCFRLYSYLKVNIDTFIPLVFKTKQRRRKIDFVQ